MVHMGGESWRAIKDLKAPFRRGGKNFVIYRSKGWACGSSADMYIYFSKLFLLLLYCCLFFIFLYTYICFPIILSY